MEYYIKNDCFSLKQTLESGQCFRWKRESDGSYKGIAGSRPLSLRQEADGVTLIVENEADYPYWERYFDLTTDYGSIIESFAPDKTLYEAATENRGVRILRQEPFETLISFIISQNNNIPRIIGIIDRLCEAFGEKVGDFYTFPTAERLSSLSESDLSPLRAGFRARYILDAARKTADNTVNLESIYDMGYDEGKALLKTIVGVGDKVSDCVLLFAYHKTEAFPTDVWIKRIVAEYYSDGLPECMGNNKGIAQQYLFEYFRKRNEN